MRALDNDQGGEVSQIETQPYLTENMGARGPLYPGLEPSFWLSSESHLELDNQTQKEPQRRLGGCGSSPSSR